MKLSYFAVIFLLLCSFIVEEIPAQSFETGEIAVILNDFGRVRVLKDSLAGIRQIDRSSFLGGVNQNYVFSYRLSAESEEPMTNVQNPMYSDFEIYGSINNSWDTTFQSPDFLVKHNVYGWNGGGYALVKFTVINRESADLNTVLGMEIISQIDGSYGLESIQYLPGSEIISIYRLPASVHVGYKLVSHTLTTLRSFEWYSNYNNNNPDLWGWLTYGQIDTLYDSGGDGAVSVFSKDAVNIPAGDSAIFWVAVSIGDDGAEMAANMLLAEEKYSMIMSVEEIPYLIPSAYKLEQNYPNPFNPSTTIQFSIPQSEFVSLKVYDILGNEVANPVNQYLEQGSYKVQFNAASLASGVYFYQLITGSYSETKKMNLIK